jgi:hypothetical protein
MSTGSWMILIVGVARGSSMSRPSDRQSGAAIAELIVALVGIVVICATGWYVWRSRENAYGSLNSAQSVTDAKVSAAPQRVGYLTIPEAGVKLPLTDAIKDAYYSQVTIDGSVYYVLSVHALDSYPECRASQAVYGLASLGGFTNGQSNGFVDLATAYPRAPVINGKRYYIQPSKSSCVSSSDTKNATIYGRAITAFANAYPGIVASDK